MYACVGVEKKNENGANRATKRKWILAHTREKKASIRWRTTMCRNECFTNHSLVRALPISRLENRFREREREREHLNMFIFVASNALPFESAKSGVEGTREIVIPKCDSLEWWWLLHCYCRTRKFYRLISFQVYLFSTEMNETLKKILCLPSDQNRHTVDKSRPIYICMRYASGRIATQTG